MSLVGTRACRAFLALRGDLAVALSLLVAPLAGVADAEAPTERRASRATTMQPIITDPVVRERLRSLIGQEVTLRGVAVERISAHHHTPLLLADVAFEPVAQPSTGAVPRVVTAPSTANAA